MKTFGEEGRLADLFTATADAGRERLTRWLSTEEGRRTSLFSATAAAAGNDHDCIVTTTAAAADKIQEGRTSLLTTAAAAAGKGLSSDEGRRADLFPATAAADLFPATAAAGLFAATVAGGKVRLHQAVAAVVLSGDEDARRRRVVLPAVLLTGGEPKGRGLLRVDAKVHLMDKLSGIPARSSGATMLSKTGYSSFPFGLCRALPSRARIGHPAMGGRRPYSSSGVEKEVRGLKERVQKLETKAAVLEKFKFNVRIVGLTGAVVVLGLVYHRQYIQKSEL